MKYEKRLHNSQFAIKKKKKEESSENALKSLFHFLTLSHFARYNYSNVLLLHPNTVRSTFKFDEP